MPKTQNVKLIAVILTISTILSLPVKAYQIIGGEMYYECLGQDPDNADANLYKVHLIMYRECISFPHILKEKYCRIPSGYTFYCKRYYSCGHNHSYTTPSNSPAIQIQIVLAITSMSFRRFFHYRSLTPLILLSIKPVAETLL